MLKKPDSNPEKIMILLFPFITFTLFVVAAVVFWLFPGGGLASLMNAPL